MALLAKVINKIRVRVIISNSKSNSKSKSSNSNSSIDSASDIQTFCNMDSNG